jgi:hypothetical protein
VIIKLVLMTLEAIGATKTVRSQLTLIELGKRTNNGNLITIAEVMDETNDILKDAPMIEANQATGHLITRRNSLPTGTFRKLNGGVSAEASSTTQLTEPMFMLDALSKVDEKLVKLAPDPISFRNGEDMAFVEGLAQSIADTLIYGNMGTYPERINGIATRYNELSYDNVYNGGGSGSDLTSIFIIQWDPVWGCHLIYPRGSKSMGVEAIDMGVELVDDSDSNPFRAYRTYFTSNMGLAIHDDRCVARICNIETAVGAAANIFDEDILIRALRNLPHQGKGAVIYANRTILAQMDIRSKDKANVNYGTGDIYGVPTTTFRGVPVRQVDAILNTETALT